VCSKCHSGLAWIILLIPVLIGIGFMYIIFEFNYKYIKNTNTKNIIDNFGIKLKKNLKKYQENNIIYVDNPCGLVGHDELLP